MVTRNRQKAERSAKAILKLVKEQRGAEGRERVAKTCNGRAFVFHCEASDDNDPKKAQGLIGVRDEETCAVVAGPIDPTTWKRVETFVRFAVK
jgi:hypothetical protein